MSLLRQWWRIRKSKRGLAEAEERLALCEEIGHWWDDSVPSPPGKRFLPDVQMPATPWEHTGVANCKGAASHRAAQNKYVAKNKAKHAAAVKKSYQKNKSKVLAQKKKARAAGKKGGGGGKGGRPRVC